MMFSFQSVLSAVGCQLKYCRKCIIVLLVTFLVSEKSMSQIFPTDQTWIQQLDLSGEFPENFLNSRTAVFHSFTFTTKELQLAQEYFQNTGVDAVVYFPIDMLIAGADVAKTFADYLTKREVSNLVFLEKNENSFRISATKFTNTEKIVEPKASAWSVSNKSFLEALKVMYRSATVKLKKQNLLVNELPEVGLPINLILGKRNEFFAVDLKVDPLAVPKFGDAAMDKELEEIFATNFPYKYKLVEAGTSEKEMRKQGLLYVVYFIHTRGAVAKELLGYNTIKSETAFVSVTFPEHQQQLKNIPANQPVYKVYFKHIDSQNVFLGNKWDADLTWQQALLNNIRAMKAELRIN